MSAHSGTIRNLSDIAKLVGVTPAAVSLALRDSPQLSDELKSRIRQLAEAHDYKPRSYRKRKTTETATSPFIGPILLINNDKGEDDPVANAVIPKVMQLSEQYGFELLFRHYLELGANPGLMNNVAGIIFYNDPENVTIPEQIPAAQIFGWKPQPEKCDRITANDEQIVNLAIRQLTADGPLKKAVIAWRIDSIVSGIPHPRIERFIEKMTALEVEVLPMGFNRDDADIPARLAEFLGNTPYHQCGFFGFNGVSGLKLCCALDNLGILAQHGPRQVVICDNTLLLNSFWPLPHRIDLDFPTMTERAVSMLLWRLQHPDSPKVLAMQEARLLPGGN